MSKLGYVAQRAMDKFYLDFKSEDDFLDIDFFKEECLAARSFFLKQEYYATKSEFSMVYLSGDWTKLEELAVQYNKDEKFYFSTLPYTVINFPIDSWSMGVQFVQTFSGTIFDRMKVNAAWESRVQDNSPPSVYYFVRSNQIVYVNNGIQMPKKVLATLIPSADNCSDDSDFIPDLVETEVVQMVVDSAFKAFQIRNGKIDVLADQNPNKQNESDIPALKKESE